MMNSNLFLWFIRLKFNRVLTFTIKNSCSLVTTYISDGVPSNVIAEMKLHARDKVVGVNVICLEASKYSAVAFPVFRACLSYIYNSKERIDKFRHLILLFYSKFKINMQKCAYLLFQAQNTPIKPEMDSVTASTTYSSQPNLAWRSDKVIFLISLVLIVILSEDSISRDRMNQKLTANLQAIIEMFKKLIRNDQFWMHWYLKFPIYYSLNCCIPSYKYMFVCYLFSLHVLHPWSSILINESWISSNFHNNMYCLYLK